MSDNGLSIEMLPARHGDALWIEWGASNDRHRMLIDGGPAAAIDDVRRRVELLDRSERHLDLMIVTHIDLDHIAGAIELFEDKSLGLDYGDVWFNDYRHLTDEPPSRGALQGEYLAGLLDDEGLPWNEAFDRRAVRVEPTGILPRVPLAAGLSLVLLSPTPDKLLELHDEWIKTLEDAKKKEADRAAGEQPSRTRGGRVKFGTDDSKANGSSIAVIAEYQDERWLLAGDAHADVLLAGLQRYGKEIGEPRVRLDGFKLAHHASARNISQELLAAIDCRRFLVSTNGAYFKHPDHECLDLIVGSVDQPELVFNYRTKFTEPWAAPSDRFTASFSEQAVATEASPRSEADDTAPGLPSDDRPAPVLPTWAHDSTASTASDDTAPTTDVAVVAEPVTSEERRVQVRVIHGGLERAAHPVLVGHYRATPLSGAEGFVDRRYGRRLSDHLATDRYPGDIGESLLIEAPRHKHPHNGVLVVGLGEYGELTPNRLVETTRAALVRYALNQADRYSRDEPIELAISSVLLGATGEQGLSIASSARAVLDGVCEANRGLRSRQGGARAIFTGLELWERNAPEAELAFRSFDERPVAILDGLGPSAAAEYVPPTDLEIAEGAMNDSLPIESRDARWWRVRIADHSAEPSIVGSSAAHLDLEFTVGGRLARTGTVIHRVERRRLERILRDTVWREQPASGVHTTLFELLFPNQLKWDLMAAQDIQLEVDDTTADIPWEMLAARNPEDGERGQLALRASLVRQLKLTDVPRVRRSTKPAALVIGNPPVGRLAPTLEGAYDEATSVCTVLRQGGFEVTDHCFDTEQQPDDATTLSIETALFADDYRIIHIAAHGFYQPDDITRTGVAIGRDDFLTASVFRQLNVIPDVVFLNCCHLGAIAVGVESGALEFTRRNLNRLGASLARELIGSGVRAVVVAGWAVHDLAAQEFATTFYRAMLDGKPFGGAVRSARAAAWNAAPDHSTWGAYQCYGDGGYALPNNDRSLDDVGSLDPPRTGREARRWLDSIVNRIASVGVEQSNEFDRSRLEGELEAIQRGLTERNWLGQGQLCVRLAQAWQALGDFDKAVDWYSQALTADDGAMTLGDVEQLANLRDRLAASLTRNRKATKAERRRADTLIEQSMESITLLEQLSRSGERSALRAGHHKRRATTAVGAERLAALDAAAQCYLASYRQDGTGYALFNFIQLEEIRSRIAGDNAAVDAVTDDFDRQLAVDDDSTYWNAVGRPDGQLTKALLDGTIATSLDVLVESYSAVFGGPSTWAQRSSTLDHLLDLAELDPDTAHKQALRALHDELAAIG